MRQRVDQDVTDDPAARCGNHGQGEHADESMRACTAVSAPLSPNTKVPVGSSASGGGSVVMRGVYPVRGSGSQAGEYQPDWNANEKDEDQQPVAVQAPLSGAGDWPYPSRA